MLEITSLNNGIVIDHIKKGTGIKIYQYLNLDKLEDEVALILNADSTSMGRKDIVKIENNLDLNLDAIAILDPNATVNIIKNEKVVEKKQIELPEVIEGVFECQNPVCVTTTEREVKSRFELVDRQKHTYKCSYCDHFYNVEE